MRNILKRKTLAIIMIALSVLCLSFSVGCDSGTVDSGDSSEITLALDKNEIEMQTGDKAVVIVATVEGSEDDVEWLSSNTAVATVLGGAVRPVGAGDAVITAKIGDKTATCNVNVLEFNPVLTLNKSVSLLETEETSVSVSIASHNRVVPGISYVWVSDDTDIATVDVSGKIKGVSAGYTTVKVTTNGLGEGKEISEEISVTVKAKTVSFKVNRLIQNSEGVWVKDVENETVTCKPNNESIYNALWSYKGKIIYTEKFLEDPDSQAFEGFDGMINEDGSTVLDVYYSDAVPVANTDGKGFFFYAANSWHLGSYGVTYKHHATFEGKENVTEIDHTAKVYTTFVGMSKKEILQNGYDRFTFYLYYDSSDTSNVVIQINNVPASFHMSDNIANISDYVTITDATGETVGSTTDGAWYKVTVDLNDVNIFKEEGNGLAGLNIQLRCEANANYYIAGATLETAPIPVYANYTVEYYKNNGSGTYEKVDSATETKNGIVGKNGYADIKFFEGYFVNTSVNGTAIKGEIKDDDSLVLKLYYDVAIPVANSDGQAHFYKADGQGNTGSSGTSFAYVGTYQGKEDVYSFTEITSRVYSLIVGVDNEYPSVNGYKTLRFNMYVDVDDLSSVNVVMNMNSTVGGSLFSLHSAKTESGYNEKVIKFFGANGKRMWNVVGKQWVNVVVNLDGVSGNSNDIAPRIHTEIGAEAGTVIYIQGATFSTEDYNTLANYTVEHYKYDITDNKFVISGTDTLSGIIGETVTGVYKTFEGFQQTETNNTVLSGEVLADGSLVLKLYYDVKEVGTANYKVEHYTKVNGVFTINSTDELSAEAGTTVTAQPKIIDGFFFDDKISSTVKSGVASIKTPLTLKLYYQEGIVIANGNGAYFHPVQDDGTVGHKGIFDVTKTVESEVDVYKVTTTEKAFFRIIGTTPSYIANNNITKFTFKFMYKGSLSPDFTAFLYDASGTRFVAATIATGDMDNASAMTNVRVYESETGVRVTSISGGKLVSEKWYDVEVNLANVGSLSSCVSDNLNVAFRTNASSEFYFKNLQFSTDNYYRNSILIENSDEKAYLALRSDKAVNVLIDDVTGKIGAPVNGDKEVYSLTSTVANDHRTSILGIDKNYISTNGIKKLTFKVYISEDFTFARFYMMLGSATVRCENTNLSGEYKDIFRVFDSEGNRIYEVTKGTVGAWYTIEVDLGSAENLSTETGLCFDIYVTMTAYNDNVNIPVYLSEVAFSTEDVTSSS